MERDSKGKVQQETLTEQELIELAVLLNMPVEQLKKLEALQNTAVDGSDKFTKAYVMGHSGTKNPIRIHRGPKNREE